MHAKLLGGCQVTYYYSQESTFRWWRVKRQVSVLPLVVVSGGQDIQFEDGKKQQLALSSYVQLSVRTKGIIIYYH